MRLPGPTPPPREPVVSLCAETDGSGHNVLGHPGRRSNPSAARGGQRVEIAAAVCPLADSCDDDVTVRPAGERERLLEGQPGGQCKTDYNVGVRRRIRQADAARISQATLGSGTATPRKSGRTSPPQLFRTRSRSRCSTVPLPLKSPVDDTRGASNKQAEPESETPGITSSRGVPTSTVWVLIETARPNQSSREPSSATSLAI